MDKKKTQQMSKKMKMRKRRRKVWLMRTGIFVVLVVGFTGMLIAADKKKQEAQQKEAQEEANQQMLKEREEKIEESLETLDEYYEAYLEGRNYISEQTNQEKEFSQWFYETYLEEDYEKLFSFIDTELLDDMHFYDEIGESTHVLHDRYQARVSAENHIYEREGKTEEEAEITIAGDLLSLIHI